MDIEKRKYLISLYKNILKEVGEVKGPKVCNNVDIDIFKKVEIFFEEKVAERGNCIWKSVSDEVSGAFDKLQNESDEKIAKLKGNNDKQIEYLEKKLEIIKNMLGDDLLLQKIEEKYILSN